MIHGDLPLVGSLYIIPLRSIDKLFPGALRMAVSLHSTAPRLSYPMAHITVRCHAINASLSPTPPPLGAKLMAHCRSLREAVPVGGSGLCPAPASQATKLSALSATTQTSPGLCLML